MTKTLTTAALAAALATSLVTIAAEPAEAHRRHRVVAAPVVETQEAVGCGWSFGGCGVRTCRPAAYYDMTYDYAIASMTPTFGMRAPRVRTCW